MISRNLSIVPPMKMWGRLVRTGLLLCLAAQGVPANAQEGLLPQDRAAAVIFSYQMIGEDLHPSASIGKEQFAEHIAELRTGGYTVLPLPDIVRALKEGAALPPRTVALTFDGGHRSVLENGVPLLIENEIPFTVFVSTGYLDADGARTMNWDDLRKLARNELVTVGLHPASYDELSASDPGEIRRQINAARARLREMAEIEADLFAYPFGSYSTAYRDIVAASGFGAAFGQQSSVAWSGSDPYALPRFTMTESFGDLDRFRMTASALPLPVADVEPKNPDLSTAHPAIGFTVDEALKGQLAKLSCFVSGQEKPQVELVSGNRVELRLEKDFDEKRARVNCTLPGPVPQGADEPRWRWFGMLLNVPVTEP